MGYLGELYKQLYGHEAWEDAPKSQTVAIQVGREVLKLAVARGPALHKYLLNNGRSAGLSPLAITYLTSTLLGDRGDWPQMAPDTRIAMRVLCELVAESSLAAGLDSKFPDGIPTASELMAVDMLLVSYAKMLQVTLADDLAGDLTIVCRRLAHLVADECQKDRPDWHPAWCLKKTYLISLARVPRVFAPNEDILDELAQLAGQSARMKFR